MLQFPFIFYRIIALSRRRQSVCIRRCLSASRGIDWERRSRPATSSTGIVNHLVVSRSGFIHIIFGLFVLLIDAFLNPLLQHVHLEVANKQSAERTATVNKRVFVARYFFPFFVTYWTIWYMRSGRVKTPTVP